MTWRRFAFGLGILPLLALLSGCGSSFSAGSDGGVSETRTPGDADTEASSDTGTGPETSPPPDAMPRDAAMPLTPGCPTDPPIPKASCTPALLACEYGTSNNPGCNTIYLCALKGWEVYSTPKNSTDCPATTSCPSSYNADVGVCVTKNLQCVYTGTSGGVCVCNELAGSMVLDWNCEPASTSCISPRPRLGTPCEVEMETCNYEQCAGGVQIECKGGYWVSSDGACVD